MKLAGNSRHLDVQLLADQYGNAIYIFGRDCSVQTQRKPHQLLSEVYFLPVTPDFVWKSNPRACAQVRTNTSSMLCLVNIV
jgi:acetyl-CoA carboxylase/biotin carboxylase 1